MNEATPEPLFDASGLVKTYGGRTVVNGVEISVARGEIVGLLGPNGAGKTTTFRMSLGLIRPDAGEVYFQGEEVSRQPVYRRARLGMGYLAQDPSVFRNLSVEENLLSVLEWMPGLSKEDRHEKSEVLLERFHLGGLADQKAGHLSGGEKRRLEIARVLARDPSLILLDEPFANIDPITVEEIQGILQDLRDQGMGILLTDHNVRETLTVTDRSYIIVEGQIFRHGTAAELVQDPLVRRTYLGERFSMPELAQEESVSSPPSEHEAPAPPSLPDVEGLGYVRPDLAVPPEVGPEIKDPDNS